jgi:hypothetical protein
MSANFLGRGPPPIREDRALLGKAARPQMTRGASEGDHPVRPGQCEHIARKFLRYEDLTLVVQGSGMFTGLDGQVVHLLRTPVVEP